MPSAEAISPRFERRLQLQLLNSLGIYCRINKYSDKRENRKDVNQVIVSYGSAREQFQETQDGRIVRIQRSPQILPIPIPHPNESNNQLNNQSNSELSSANTQQCYQRQQHGGSQNKKSKSSSNSKSKK